jgi:NADPH:quinone reductase
MRAMQILAYGKALRLAEIDRPEPGPGEVLLRVHACGVNFADTLMAQGRYQERLEPPFTPGMEVCGTADALGPGVEGIEPGARLAAFPGRGGFAEFATAPAESCVAVPAAMPDEAAAGFVIAYGTSHVALTRRAGLERGETLLVLGASGGVGLTAVEIGRLLGARVIAVTSGPEKAEVARAAGAHHVLDRDADLRAEVKALGGADVVYDPVGGALFDAALRACNPGARLLPIGFASGQVPQIPANILLVKNLAVHGLYFGGFARLRPDAVRGSLERLLGWYAEGRLKPLVSHVLPLEEAEAALNLLRSRAATGKVVVRVD